MNKAKWYFNRLKSMYFFEILWRIQQKVLYKLEFFVFAKQKKLIIDNTYSKENINLKKVLSKFNFVGYDNDLQGTNVFAHFIEFNNIDWHAGFCTEHTWNQIFSHELHYKQCDEIGDARINWELNRHLFLPLIAKHYYITKNKKYLNLFINLFYDWVKNNPFLIGISWTSIMEIAIRAYQWYVSFVLLTNAFSNHTQDSELKQLLIDLETGILNMMKYVFKHYSRYSSANNHLIVEMAILGIIGNAFGKSKWVNISLKTLKKEITKQIHEDGVNKEQSIHYQVFVMEALAIYIHMLRTEKIECPNIFGEILTKMCEFVADLSDKTGDIAQLGDNDEGKLLDLVGDYFNYYIYVLQFCSIILQKNYTSFTKVCDNLFFFFDKAIVYQQRPLYDNKKTKCYKKGGYTILKFKHLDCERIMTFDHGPLGYNSIAAHAHADALNITLCIDGEKIIIDPGTYVYHTKLYWRDYFRKTVNHNTIEINSKDQSEMLGPFLWGDRANSVLTDFSTTDNIDKVTAYHDGYKKIIHKRAINYYKPDCFLIIDELLSKENFNYIITYCLDNNIEVQQEDKNHLILFSRKNKIYIATSLPYSIEDCWFSSFYTIKEKSKAIKIKGTSNKSIYNLTSLSINKPGKYYYDIFDINDNIKKYIKGWK